MEITAAQFAQIEHCLPRQRGSVSLSNLQVLNAILYVAEYESHGDDVGGGLSGGHHCVRQAHRMSLSEVRPPTSEHRSS